MVRVMGARTARYACAVPEPWGGGCRTDATIGETAGPHRALGGRLTDRSEPVAVPCNSRFGCIHRILPAVTASVLRKMQWFVPDMSFPQT
jgi:hypothetical protein